MKNLLSPIGLIVFIALLSAAVIHTARKQRKANRRVVNDVAGKDRLCDLEEDNGSAQAFAQVS